MHAKSQLALLGAIALLAGCSGGSSGIAPIETPHQNASGPTTSSIKTGKIKATIKIPHGKTGKTVAGKKRDYVSPNTLGLIVSVAVNGTSYSIQGYDLTMTTSNTSCVAVSGGTDCTIYFDAPATTNGSIDAFSIYAYDASQTTGTLAATATVAGNLLSEDQNDTVPGSANGAGIVAGQDNALTFTLLPVVATQSVTPAVVSVAGGTAGTSATSSALLIDGYDADANEIQNFLNGSGDDVYVNPIAVSAGSPEIVPSVTSVTSALQDSVTFAYTPSAGDEPSSATANVPSFPVTTTDALTGGGFNAESNFPMSTVTVVVAPLFAYAPAAATSTTTGFSTSVDALQATAPSGATYTLNVTPTAGSNDCSAYGIGAAAPGAPTAPSQQATFAVATTTQPAAGTTCTLDLSDGFSTDPITFSATGSHSVITIPAKLAGAQPIQQTSGVEPDDQLYTFTGEKVGDTLVCTVAFSNYANVNSATYASEVDGSDGYYGGQYPGYGYGSAWTYGYNGANGTMTFATDVTSPGVYLSIGDNDYGEFQPAPSSYWCGEYADTSVEDLIYSATGFALGTLTTPTVTPGTAEYELIAETGGNDATPFATIPNFVVNASQLSGQNSLEVQSSSALQTNQAPIGVTFSGGTNPYDAGLIVMPITQGGSPSFGAYAKHAKPTKALLLPGQRLVPPTRP